MRTTANEREKLLLADRVKILRGVVKSVSQFVGSRKNGLLKCEYTVSEVRIEKDIYVLHYCTNR